MRIFGLTPEHHLQNWIERNDRQQNRMLPYFDDHGILHDQLASTRITCWAYEQAARAQAHVWVLGEETKVIGSYWQALFPVGQSDLPRAAE